MSDFLGGSEIAARTEMLSMNNTLRAAEIQAKKAESKGSYLSQLKAVTQEFESIFLGYMLKTMRKTVPESELMVKSMAKDIFLEMHDEEISKELARAGGIGLAAVLYKQLAGNNIPAAAPNRIDITK